MQLEDYKKQWNKKPVLRAIYSDLYQKIENVTCSGDTLEIGGGIGNLHVRAGRLIKTDIQYSIGVDVVTDAQQLPFDNEVFSNINSHLIVKYSQILYCLMCYTICNARYFSLLKHGVF